VYPRTLIYRFWYAVFYRVQTRVNCVYSQIECSALLGTEMLDRAVALMVVAACLGAVKLHHGVVYAGGPPTVSTRPWVDSRPQLTDKKNHVQLSIHHRPMFNDAVVTSGKRRQKCVDGTCFIGNRYVETETIC